MLKMLLLSHNFAWEKMSFWRYLLVSTALAAGSARANSVTCPTDSPLSCQNTTAVTDTCCFNYPGGELLQTQFWDTNPSTGPNNSWTIHGLWYSDSITRLVCLSFAQLTNGAGLTTVTEALRNSAIAQGNIPISPQFFKQQLPVLLRICKYTGRITKATMRASGNMNLISTAHALALLTQNAILITSLPKKLLISSKELCAYFRPFPRTIGLLRLELCHRQQLHTLWRLSKLHSPLIMATMSLLIATIMVSWMSYGIITTSVVLSRVAYSFLLIQLAPLQLVLRRESSTFPNTGPLRLLQQSGQSVIQFQALRALVRSPVLHLESSRAKAIFSLIPLARRVMAS